MPYQHIIYHCFAAKIGPGGLEQSVFERYVVAGRTILADLAKRKVNGSLPLLTVSERTDDLAAIARIAKDWRDRFSRIVVLGTGGSSLGGMAICALRIKRRPEIRFEDNLDADGLDKLLQGDLTRTAFLAISKSGSTAETLAQVLVCLKALGRGASKKFLVITEPGDNPLRRLARRHRIRILDHDLDIGGRFSVLSVVGLLPAALAGLDPAKIRAGAAKVLTQCLNEADPPPAVGAAIQVGLAESRGTTASVLMAYESRLDQFARWYCQLWAESLGKNGHGTLPVRALGPVDQHSQLQLYLDGPNDKFYTLVLPDQGGRGPRIDTAIAGGDSTLDYLDGHNIGDLAAAEARATTEALARRGRPVRLVRTGDLNEETMGALFMHFMLETIIAAHLLGVDPFGQPAVEEGKVLTRRYLAEGRAAP